MTVVKHSLMGCACPPSPCQKPPKKKADDDMTTYAPAVYHVGEVIHIAGKLSRNGIGTTVENVALRLFKYGVKELISETMLDLDDEGVYSISIETTDMFGEYVLRFVVYGENEGETVVADSDVVVTIID